MAERRKRKAQLPAREPMLDVTLRLPRELLERAKARAAAEERPVGWLLRKLIATGLEKPER